MLLSDRFLNAVRPLEFLALCLFSTVSPLAAQPRANNIEEISSMTKNGLPGDVTIATTGTDSDIHLINSLSASPTSSQRADLDASGTPGPPATPGDSSSQKLTPPFEWKSLTWRPGKSLPTAATLFPHANNLFHPEGDSRYLSQTVRMPVLFLPQAATGAPSISPPQSKSVSPKRNTGKVALIIAGLGLVGGGTALWMNGKNHPNSNYNPEACRQALATSGSQFPSVIGSSDCRETNVSWLKLAGGVTMALGASFTFWGLLK